MKIRSRSPRSLPAWLAPSAKVFGKRYSIPKTFRYYLSLIPKM